MAEVNFAENDKRLVENPTHADAYRMGSTHAAYGWACTPYGHWSEELKQSYRKGFAEAVREDRDHG